MKITKKFSTIIYDLLSTQNRSEDIARLIEKAMKIEPIQQSEYNLGLDLYRLAYSGETSYYVAEYPFFKLRQGIDDSRYPAKGFVAAAAQLNAAKDFVDVRDIAKELKIDEDHWFWLTQRLAEMNDVFIQRGAIKLGLKPDGCKIITMSPRSYPVTDSERRSALARGQKPPKDKSKEALVPVTKNEMGNTIKLANARQESATLRQPPKSNKDITQKLHEANIESIIAQNLELIEKGLVLVQRQFACSGIGRIDLLCKDINSNLVVIELKGFGTKQDTIIDQITRYMGWVKAHFAQGTQKVRGFIVVPKADDKLGYAVGAIPNVEIKTFKVSFP